MTAALVSIMQLQREAAQLVTFSRMAEQKLQALSVRDGIEDAAIARHDDLLYRTLHDARCSTLAVVEELNELLSKVQVTP